MAEDLSQPQHEEISKDTLISLLKDKSKEIKIQKMKLKKIEERFKKMSRESRSMKKDIRTFSDVLNMILNGELGAEDSPFQE